MALPQALIGSTSLGLTRNVSRSSDRFLLERLGERRSLMGLATVDGRNPA